MLVIRFSRVGKRNKPQFKIVIQEHTKAPTGRHIEIVGSYDPHLKAVQIDKEKVEKWISQGAQPSPSVHNILVSQGIIDAPKKKIKLSPKKQKGEETQEDEKASEKEEAQGKVEKKEVKTEKTDSQEAEKEGEKSQETEKKESSEDKQQEEKKEEKKPEEKK